MIRNRISRPPLQRLFSSSTISIFDPDTKQWPITCTFDPACTYNYLKQVEKKWMPVTSSSSSSTATAVSRKETNYILSMIPYPSGSLHLGHVKVYTSGDMISRYLKLKGHDVVTPLGWDSFGLPAENAAFDRDLNPADWTYRNISEMRSQLDQLCLNVSYREATSDPSFYKWTQFLITQLFDKKLLYRSRALVNWDPVDKTVLADDQVDEEGKSWRSGAKVEKRFLTQWFIKTSRFAQDLWEGKDIDRSTTGVNSKGVHDQQRNFMGKIDGRIFYLNTVNEDVLPVFTTDPALFLNDDAKILISSDHWIASSQTVTEAYNPFTRKVMVIQVSPDVKTKWKATIASGTPSGGNSDQVKRVILEDESIGGYPASSSYTDWLISRQRYWGTPFPIIHCPECGPVAVPLKDLPVVLPAVSDFQALKCNTQSDSDVVSSKLNELAPKDWLNCSCPKCGSAGKRETDTLDTFVDSSWYYLRNATNPSSNKAFSGEFWSEHRVSAYLGGPEHAHGHLLTSRLMFHFLRSIGSVKHPKAEPYEKFLLQGIINSKSYRGKDGRYLWQKEAEERIARGELKKEDLIITNEKMSKSKKNGVNPVDLIERYGTDATRITVLGFGNSHRVRFWRGTETEFEETTAFIRKMLLTMDQFIFLQQIAVESASAPVIRRFAAKNAKSQDMVTEELQLIKQMRNAAVRDVAFSFEHNYRIGLACMKIRALNEILRRNNLVREIGMSIEFQKTLGDLIIMISSIAPNFSTELWLGFVAYADRSLSDRYNFDAGVHQQCYPKLDPDFVNLIDISFNDELHAFDGKDILNQPDEEAVKKAAIEFMKQTDSSFDPADLIEFEINFLPNVKATVRLKSKSYIPELKSKKRKKKNKKDEDLDDD